MAVAALQEGVITPYTVRNDPGYWRIPNSKTNPSEIGYDGEKR